MKKQPLKEKLKAIGGGHLLNESHAWERKFGEPLPTLDSVQKKKNKGTLTEEKAQVGFSNEMGALYISKRGQNNGKSYELKKADIEQIIKQYKKFKSKLD